MIRALQEYALGERFGQIRSVSVALGRGDEPGVLFIHSTTENLDPWTEMMAFPTDTLKLSLFTESGRHLWTRDLGKGVIPGIWFAPVISFDLDGDGVDEIWHVGNDYPNLPFTVEHRHLERIDPRTNEVTGMWPWPINRVSYENMSYSYRLTLACGYAKGEPVLITAQGTYTDMYLQGYSRDMSQRWSVFVPKDAAGARASHVFPVLDFNNDGIDELFWGERVLSVHDGRELFCCDRDNFRGHSDIIIPFVDPQTGKKYIYTCREDGEGPGIKRVVTFDERGDPVWGQVDAGHIHGGWIANIGPNRRRIAMARSLALNAKGYDQHRQPTIDYFFDAVTGEPTTPKFPQPGGRARPIDVDGDGYHEFLTGMEETKVVDRHGKELANLGNGRTVRTGKILELPAHQVMLSYDDQGIVRIWGDDAAVDGPTDQFAHYHRFMQHMMGSGYNHFGCVQSCGM